MLPTTISPLVDLAGRPMPAASISTASHTAGDRFDRELYSWDPIRRSADGALLPDLSTIVARTEDLVRNNGLMSGAVQLYVDTVIGSGLRLCAKPDWRALGQTPEWAAEWSRLAESGFRQWAYHIDNVSDCARRKSLAGRLGQACRALLLKGESFAIAEWRPGRGPGIAATAIRMINADRVENPNGEHDSATLRRGIRLNSDGAPVAIYVRNGHPTDWYTTERGNLPVRATWRRVPMTTPWGRRRVLHVFDESTAEQSHGKSPFAAMLKRSKKLDRWEDVTLESAVINAMFAATIESDLASAVDAIGGTDLSEYVQQVLQWNAGKAVEFDGAKIPHLFPGEKLQLNRPGQPTEAFASFENAFNRHFAAGLGMSFEQFARDYSQTNYSGAMAGMQDSWRMFRSRRNLIQAQHATQEYALWLEEAVDNGSLPTPPGAPSFYAAKTAWCNCSWIGPGKGHADPLKDSKGQALQLEYGVTTLEEWCADQGRDWEEVLEQRAAELQRQRELEARYQIAFASDALTAAMGAPDNSGGPAE